jgi:hypothetical protein
VYTLNLKTNAIVIKYSCVSTIEMIYVYNSLKKNEIEGIKYMFGVKSLIEKKMRDNNKMRDMGDNFKIAKSKNFSMANLRFH